MSSSRDAGRTQNAWKVDARIPISKAFPKEWGISSDVECFVINKRHKIVSHFNANGQYGSRF